MYYIVKLRTDAAKFYTANEALSALHATCKDTDLSLYRALRVHPTDHGWECQLLTRHSFIRFVGTPAPCGHSEPESDYRDPDTGAHRTAFCEGGRLVVRGTGNDSVTNGSVFITGRACSQCAEKLKEL